MNDESGRTGPIRNPDSLFIAHHSSFSGFPRALHLIPRRRRMAGMLEGRIAVAVRQERVAEIGLLRAGLAGDRAALEQLLAPYERPLFTLCRGILGSAED